MKVSIIIPTYNEVNDLGNCLFSLSLQTFKDFEIIVVDDGSTDSTLQMLHNAGGAFKLFNQSHLGAGAARNLGAKNAKGEILVFVDSDMTFDKNFVKKLIEPIFKNKSKGTFSKNENVSNWNNVWARCWNFNEGWVKGKRHPKNYPDIQPVFRAILKKEFDRVSGFTVGGYDDDWSLSKKLGYMATVSSNAVFFHKNPASLSETFKHAKWVGKRKYKFGVLGSLFTLTKISLPFSIVIGLYKSAVYKTWQFLIFKIVYDLGNSIGIINFLFTKKGSK